MGHPCIKKERKAKKERKKERKKKTKKKKPTLKNPSKKKNKQTNKQTPHPTFQCTTKPKDVLFKNMFIFCYYLFIIIFWVVKIFRTYIGLLIYCFNFILHRGCLYLLIKYGLTKHFDTFWYFFQWLSNVEKPHKNNRNSTQLYLNYRSFHMGKLN